MKARRAEAREPAIYTASLHWITLAPAVFCLGIAAAVQRWGTSTLFERVGWDTIPAELASTTGFELDATITVLALLIGIPVFIGGVSKIFSTRFRVTASGVRWEHGRRDVSAGFGTIGDVEVEQGLFGRLLGYGTVTLRGRNAIGRRRDIARPAEFRAALNNAMSAWLCRDLGQDPRRKKAVAS
jgi:hypothetical protein